MYLLLIAIVSFILPLSAVALFDLDEGAFSEATREMLVGGDYITTYLNGNLRFDKPILIYWFQLLSVKVFGLNEFALRLPSALAATAWMFAIYLFTKKVYNKNIAFIASVFMATSLQISIIAKAAIADSLLNFFITTAMFSIWIYIDKKNQKHLLIAFALIAFGTLTKGPVAIMIPLVSTFIYLSLKREFKIFFKMIFDYRGIIIFLIIVAPWYYLEYQAQGQKFIDGFFLKHNLQRFNSTFESHRGSFLYYVPVLIAGFFPFSGILLKVFQRIKEIFKSELELFLAIWFVFVFIFFSFSGTKLPHYVIYGYTPLFILMAIYFKDYKFSIIFPTFLVLVLAFLPEFVHLVTPKNEYIKEILSSAKDSFNLNYQIISFIVAILLLLALKISNTLLRVTFVGVVFISYINFIVIKSYAKIAQEPIKEAAFLAKEKGLNVIMYKFTRPSFLVYLEKKSLKKKPDADDIVFTKVTSLKDFKKFKILYHKSGVYLIKVER